MYSKIYTKKILVLPVLAVLMLGSCKKFVENGTPPNAISQDKAYVDSATATSVILGLYSLNSTSTSTLANNRYGAMSADDAYFLTSTTYDAFKNNTLAAGNDANTLWNSMYTTIGRANYAIEGVESSSLSTSVKNQLLGEAKFWRAYYYFFLTNFFGDVPLVTSTNALETGLTPKTPAAQVYQQMVTDLVSAKSLLTNTYPSAERARVNKRVAAAMLARVYFYQQNWAATETEATEVISSGVYSLETFANSFIKTSNETIWQIANVPGVTGMGPEWIPASTTPTFVLYDTLANTFETGDLRKANWAKSIVYSGKTYYYPFKYKLRTGTTGNEYSVMIRLAEMYLIRAEARAQLNNISGAQTDLNAVRTRAGLGNTTAATQPALLAAIEHERWVELFTESSDRWFNLKRLNKATSTLGLIKAAWKPFQQLYPVPLQEMQANPNLVQNTGY
jgi:hypothetical protein